MDTRRGLLLVRSGLYLRGFSNLAGRYGEQVRVANLFIDFTVAALKAQLGVDDHRMILLEHPEDSGAKTGQGAQGSIWRWAILRNLMDRKDITTGALGQSDWGRAFLIMTRILGRLEGLSRVLCMGPRVRRGGQVRGSAPL